MTILTTKNLSKTYKNTRRGFSVKALKNLNLDIEKGEFLGIMGPSGSGKTTLLNILATIDSPSSGSVYINGENPHEMKEKDLAIFRRDNLGFIFQEFNLLESLTIEENIILPLVLKERPKEEIEAKLGEISKILGIEDILKKRSYEVSGGQRQRTAAARAIIGDVQLVLADEPTGNLDSKSSFDLMTSLVKLNEDRKSTIVMVTHDAFAASFCKRIVLIKDGEKFLELERQTSREDFFTEIINSLKLLAGGHNENI